MAYPPNFRSAYAAPRRAPRWPWAFASILLVAVIAATALLLNDGLEPGDSGRQLAAVQNTQPADSDATLTPEPTATYTPVPTATAVDVTQPTAIAENWMSYWEAGDYASMYQLTSDATRQSMTEEEFIGRYQAIENEAGLTAIDAEVTGEASLAGAVPFSVTFTSSLVGEIQEENELFFTREGDNWRVVWTPGTVFRDLGTSGCVDFVAESMNRGRILDRNGKVLAEDAAVARVSVIPANVSDPATTYAAVSEVTGVPVSTIEERVASAGGPDWAVPIKDLPASENTNLINALQPYNGVQVTRATQRSYPYGPVTAHLVGWVSIATQEDIERDESGLIIPDQLIGRAGLELGANELLTGKPGGRLLIVECETRAERFELGVSEGDPPRDIYLTVDVDFQIEVDKALTALVKDDPDSDDDDKKLAERSSAVVIDPRTGGVLAMVSHPTFDPNGFITGDFSEEDLAVMNDPLLTAQANRATRQAYPTGSIFKLITTAGAMKDLGYTAETPINCPASFELAGVEWNDWVMENGMGAQGMMNLHWGLVNSCNTVFYQIAVDLDTKDEHLLPDMARAFGLGAPTGIPYFPEIAGVVPDPEWKLENMNDGWARGDAVNLSIGQGFQLATPLQMANAYAAIANGGTLLQPYVVDRTQVEGEDPVQVGERTVIRELPLTDEQISQIQAMLRDQTSNASGYGSYQVFGDFSWPISGKTGTAQNQLDGTDRPHSWFAAYGPYPGDGSEATIASVVMVENVGEGVSYAAPATKAIYTAYIRMEHLHQLMEPAAAPTAEPAATP
ncbi:MAG TPA: penicillin-binding transpeptidase domain-containing protein [Thermomicrobiales bacterium]|nr:penicillin-binding transpeptidase domain-containing protein [Thermomicrobiales bacterium]